MMSRTFSMNNGSSIKTLSLTNGELNIMKNLKTGPGFAIGAALALSALTMQAHAQSNSAADAQNASAPTYEECKDAWTESHAFDYCGVGGSLGYNYLVTLYTWHALSVSNSECLINVDCHVPDGVDAGIFGNQRPSQNQPKNNEYTGSVSDFENLRNCDGTLKTSC